MRVLHGIEHLGYLLASRRIAGRCSLVVGATDGKIPGRRRNDATGEVSHKGGICITMALDKIAGNSELDIPLKHLHAFHLIEATYGGKAAFQQKCLVEAFHLRGDSFGI